MRQTYSFYDPATGLFTGRQMTGSESALALNTPEGLKAIAGQYDPLSERVNEQGSVVDYEPPSPGDDYEWDHEARHWVLSAAAQQAIDADVAARARLAEIDLQSVRALREAAIGNNTDAIATLATLEQEAVPLRNDVITEDTQT
jgi:hypothetical protein